MGRSKIVLASLLFILPSANAFASLDKLDGLARVAFQELRKGPNQKTIRLRTTAAKSNVLDVFIRGSASRAELEAAGARVRTALPGVCTAYVPLEAVEAVAALGGVERIEGSMLVEPLTDVAVPASGVDVLRGAPPAFPGLNGDGVLMGVVDSGLDLEHEDFLDEAGNTRVVALWDHSISGSPPAGFSYGHECTQAEIDAGSCPQSDFVAHGTYVTGIAAGDGSQTGGSIPAYTYAGLAPRVDLAIVQVVFPAELTEVVDAVAYIFDVATARGQDCVVNLSLGANGGPHDGSTAPEIALDALSGPGRVIVAAAGNSRGDPFHAEVFASGAGTDATMAVSGGSFGSTVLISGTYESNDNISVRITTPRGHVVGPVVFGSDLLVSTPDGDVLILNSDAWPSGDIAVLIGIQETGGQDIDGTWTFTFIPVSIGAAGEVDLWRFQGGSLSSFVIGLDPDEIVANPATANEVIGVAAYVTKNSWIGCNGVPGTTPEVLGEIGSFSSPGPRRDGGQKPDIAAPGAEIAGALTGDIISFCQDPPAISHLLPDGPSHWVAAGTSSAAPVVSGAVALLLQAHGSLTPAQVKALLFDQAKTDGFTGPVWNKDFGNGKLFLEPTIAHQTFSKRIAAGSDDAEQSTSSSGTMSLTGSDLELVQDGSTRQVVGLRFKDITIPREAQITKAWVQFTADEENGGFTRLSILGQASDNAPTFTSSNRNITLRPLGPDSVVWTPGGWNDEGASGSAQKTPDLAAVVQAVINRAGWQKGNALALILRGTGTRTAVAYEGNRFKAAQLFIEYRTGLPANQPPVVNAGPDQNIVFGKEATLTWSVQDDGLPSSPGTTSSLWSELSGPGDVTFLPNASAPTRARFTSPGTYQLELTASDGQLSASDIVQITVTAAPIDARVSSGSDDAEESRSGSVSLTGNDLELVEDEGSRQVVGLRFRSLAIPAGSVINKAYVQFKADESQSGSIRLVFRAQNSGNAPTFTSSARNISNRLVLPDSVVWQPGSWSSGGSGSAQRTPELKSLIQAVVNVGGWGSGNALALIIRGTGHRTAESYEGEGAPVLHIEYTPPAAAPPVERLASDQVVGAGALRLAAFVAPNPMRGQGTLRLTVGRSGPVRVEVLDVQGRRVGTVLDSPQLEAGHHPIALRGAAPLAAGVYFYRVQAPEGVVRGRFVVLE